MSFSTRYIKNFSQKLSKKAPTFFNRISWTSDGLCEVDNRPIEIFSNTQSQKSGQIWRSKFVGRGRAAFFGDVFIKIACNPGSGCKSKNDILVMRCRVMLMNMIIIGVAKNLEGHWRQTFLTANYKNFFLLCPLSEFFLMSGFFHIDLFLRIIIL